MKSPLSDRVSLRAALCAQPDTPLHAAEVADILDLPLEQVVDSHAPASGLATWSTWLRARRLRPR